MMCENSMWITNKMPNLGILFVFQERNPDLEIGVDG